jgi:hypothetical protein
MEKACSTHGRGHERNAYEIFVEKLKVRDREEDLDIGGRIILNWIIQR